MLAHFGIAAMREIPRVVYEAGFSRERISLLAPAVAAAARDGRRRALRIMARAGQELATTALGVIRQLFQPGDAVDVYLTGGVFNAGAPCSIPSMRRCTRAGRPPKPDRPDFRLSSAA